MGAVGGGEGVVDVEIAEAGETLRHRRIVLLLAPEEAGIFEDGDVARLEHRYVLLRHLPVDVAHRPAEHLLIGPGDERQGIVRARRFRPTEMGEEEDDGTLVGELGHRRQGGSEAGVVGHF